MTDCIQPRYRHRVPRPSTSTSIQPQFQHPVPASSNQQPALLRPSDLIILDDETAGARNLGARLLALGLQGVTRVRLTTNRTVMVSFRAGELRVHRGYLGGPPLILQAIVDFVNGRGAARRRARQALLAYPIEPPARSARREAPHPDHDGMVRRLREAHGALNRERFSGVLGDITIRVSRRMRSRLGYFRLPSPDFTTAEIVISRRHIRRHGWANALDTLLHEMVHQWQHEQGMPVDHGRGFREMARRVGVAPRAKRAAVT